jgi:hypothetical protein
MNKKLLNPISMFVIGLLFGIISKILDIYDNTQYFGFTFGGMFSEFSIWILIGVLISIYSENKKEAMLNIFPFCIGMLISYYITAELTNSIYSMIFIKKWLIFALFSPIMAYFTWMTKEKGIFPKIISISIIIVTIMIDLIIFGGPRIYDFIIIIILFYLLFIKKIKRKNE